MSSSRIQCTSCHQFFQLSRQFQSHVCVGASPSSLHEPMERQRADAERVREVLQRDITRAQAENAEHDYKRAVLETIAILSPGTTNVQVTQTTLYNYRSTTRVEISTEDPIFVQVMKEERPARLALLASTMLQRILDPDERRLVVARLLHPGVTDAVALERAALDFMTQFHRTGGE